MHFKIVFDITRRISNVQVHIFCLVKAKKLSKKHHDDHEEGSSKQLRPMSIKSIMDKINTIETKQRLCCPEEQHKTFWKI